jgi:hypothetical protein
MVSFAGVDELYGAAAELWRRLNAGTELRLLGGLAVRAHVGDMARLTRDVDVVAMNVTIREAVLALLRSEGRVTSGIGGWIRAVDRRDPRKPIIDVAAHPICNPKTFEELSLAPEPDIIAVAGFDFPVADRVDLLRLKLAAGRGQDLVDVVLLSAFAIDAKTAAQRCARDDSERPVARGANLARMELHDGGLSATFQEVMGRPMTNDETLSVGKLLEALRAEGL